MVLFVWLFLLFWFGLVFNVEVTQKMTWIFSSRLSVVRDNCKTKLKKNRKNTKKENQNIVKTKYPKT